MLAAPSKGRTVNRIVIALIIILALLLVPSPARAASGIKIVDRVGDGTWIGNTWKVNVYAGEGKATTLTFYNSSKDLAEVDISIVPNSLDDGNLLFELDKLTFTILGKSYVEVTLAVKASGSAAPGTYYSELKIKATSPPSVISPSVTTNDPIFVFTRSAILFGSLDSLGTAKTVKVYFEWGKTEDYSSTTRVQTIRRPGDFVAVITGLTPGNTYHFRAVAVGDGTSYGQDQVFRTTRR